MFKIMEGFRCGVNARKNVHEFSSSIINFVTLVLLMNEARNAALMPAVLRLPGILVIVEGE